MLAHGGQISIDLPVHNTDRAVGTLLGHEVTSRYGVNGLPSDSITVALRGSAGQSLGAFLPSGITVRLEGDANDYVGKGLSGGRIVMRPDRATTFAAEHNVIAGNVIGYGATSGSMFIRGIVGERFLVRNSGATAVVEGVGDHALEYMTGGLALILGEVGRNLGAGMSGGVAYLHRLVAERINPHSLASGELALHELDGVDREIVTDLLEAHLRETGSELAGFLLNDLENTLAAITKIMPRDFAAVLETRRDATEQGLDPDGDVVWRRIKEVTRG